MTTHVSVEVSQLKGLSFLEMSDRVETFFHNAILGRRNEFQTY